MKDFYIYKLNQLGRKRNVDYLLQMLNLYNVINLREVSEEQVISYWNSLNQSSHT